MREFLEKSTAQAGFHLNEDQIERFLKYYDILIDWNNKINLTAITQPNDVVTKHFTDSIIGTSYIAPNASVIDVGTGAGFPGIPFKIMRDDVKILLMDSLNKRINFLNEVIDNLKLTGIETMHARAEESAKVQLREQFDVATARAVANLAILSEFCLPFVKVGGLFLAYKGSDVSEEVSDAEKAIDILGGKIQEIVTYQLPFSDINHSLILIKKVRQTPAKYPRNSGKILKSPIK